jgi:DNA modification methylase
MDSNFVEFGDCRKIMQGWKKEGIKAQTCVTSPPYYGLRDYGTDGQIGLEQTLAEYVKAMVEVFSCVWDVLEDDGTLWLNLGDSYAGSNGNGQHEQTLGQSKYVPFTSPTRGNKSGVKAKNLLGVPWKVAFALQDAGWILRQDIIWHKPNPMPESVRDRCTKSHEYIFLFSKKAKYYFDNEAIKEKAVTAPAKRNKAGEGYQADYTNGARFSDGERIYGADGLRNKRDVWTVNLKPYKGAHFATFPPPLIEPCVLAGSRVNDIVLDPFMGSGTTAMVAKQHGRRYIGCELNETYGDLQDERIRSVV